jgi:hypothetical protein
VLAALLCALGLSCSAASHLLGPWEQSFLKMSMWQNTKEAGKALRKCRPAAGKVRIMGADETVFKVKGDEVVGSVVDGGSAKTLGFEVLFEWDAAAFRRWLKP